MYVCMYVRMHSHWLVAKVKLCYDAGVDAGVEATLYKHSAETCH